MNDTNGTSGAQVTSLAVVKDEQAGAVRENILGILDAVREHVENIPNPAGTSVLVVVQQSGGMRQWQRYSNLAALLGATDIAKSNLLSEVTTSGADV